MFISPTNKSHKMDFFGEKPILEESNEPSLIKVCWLAHLYVRITHCGNLYLEIWFKLNSEIGPPLFNENWCDFLHFCTANKIITHIPIFKWLSGQSRNRSIRGLWDCHNVWEPLRRGHQGPLERWWHHGMLWQTERISAYRFCQIVSVHFIIFSFLTKTSRRAPNEGAGPSPFKLEHLAVNKPLMSENLISYALTCLISAKKGDIFHQRFVIPTTYVSTWFQPPI